MRVKKCLFFSRNSLLDAWNGGSLANRALAHRLIREGLEVQFLCGSILSQGVHHDAERWLAGNGVNIERSEDPAFQVSQGVALGGPPILTFQDGMVPATVHPHSTSIPHGPEAGEVLAFARLFQRLAKEGEVELLVGNAVEEVFAKLADLCPDWGIHALCIIHNLHFRDTRFFRNINSIVTPSRFAADYYREALGLDCTVIPNVIDLGRVLVQEHKRKYLTFVNPSIEKGVFAFARIADELGRRRPDIPILVVEGRGTEADVAACGLDLRRHGTVFFMAHTHDPRQFWSKTKICLLPSLWWENQPLVAVEAMINGIPVIGSDRGGIPECLGDAGIVLPLPDRLTQATFLLPTVEEVAPWVDAIIRLWDDGEFYEEHRRKALVEAERWDPDIVVRQYVDLFTNLKPGGSAFLKAAPPGRAKAVVLVPYLNGIVSECERSLRKLEDEGVRVIRSEGNAAIDAARNRLASVALHDGFESLFFIDADIGFEALDALRLLARTEPVVSGVYAKKGRRALASQFTEGIDEVVFGASAFGMYPLKYAATGFLRIKAHVLRRMIDVLRLPLCNTKWGRGEWPFFQPMVVPLEDGGHHYLGEDWAFSHRLARIGVTPMADTSIRLRHYGPYGYSWEEAGQDSPRYATYTFRPDDR